MRKLIESTHVSLGGEIGSPQDWPFRQHLFQEIHDAPHLSLADVRRFANGVLVLVYTPLPQQAQTRPALRRDRLHPGSR
jgi:hypothetical protein